MQPGGGSPFPRSELGAALPGAPEAAAPISVRPPPTGTGFEGLAPHLAPEDEQGTVGGTPGTRWPRQETLALLKIRSDMDAAFRDATLKGPLWEEVSRKLAEFGFHRSAKKCKEKFENVHKYYKRTKEGRAGRQDGKSYRFFTQLEALHGSSTSPTAAIAAPPPLLMTTMMTTAVVAGPSSRGVAAPHVPQSVAATTAPSPAPASLAAVLSFSSNTSSYSGTESEEEEEFGEEGGGRKRKRNVESPGDSGKLMAFFEGLMQQVMERQEAMQQRFLEAIERREQDRMIREEAWRRQEMSRITREHELAAQERAAAATRDASIIAFLQNLTGQTIPVPPPPQPPPSTVPSSTPQPMPTMPPPAQPKPQEAPPPSSSTELVAIAPEPPPLPPALPPPAQQVLHRESQLMSAVAGSGGATETALSRWPKSEVHALIQIRSGMEARYQESGPKGPLWEEISAGMRRLGYNRSSKRCKEKWENINKYFKKVKESNKKRPEDAKTCPYFHQLDALYRSKHFPGAYSGASEPEPNPQLSQTQPPEQLNNITALQPRLPGIADNSEEGASKAGNPSTFIGKESSSKKPEDIVKKLMEQPPIARPSTNILEEDNLEADDEDEEDEDGNMQFRIQYQRPRVGGGGANGATGEGNFLAMVR
ncbi:hypothetical protein HPP92_025175 [Vanilla planifolia]|uniref:Myb-like domain-containing protein n=1 Tax=Vanilla planifolia TaxID=51239 RepID=A0A835PKG9_VANPL|nr:hypothetical protein HPP92_025175 [Vanilla planifolia]